MAGKKKSIWRIFRPVALVVVALVTSIFASKSPELSPVINAVGSAVQKVIMISDNHSKSVSDTVIVDSVQTFQKPVRQNDSIVFES